MSLPKIVFATNNANKLMEIKSIVSDQYQIISLGEINCTEDIPETSDTIAGNAIQKAQYLYDNYGVNCFADDTGLIVETLNGEPGVYSARYAGEQRNAEDNMNLLLQKLKNHSNRNAKFQTVIALIIDGEITTFVGEIHGEIAHNKTGEKGFGYDPIFIPNGYTTSFAEMSSDEKNKISHRGIATQKLLAYLQEKK